MEIQGVEIGAAVVDGGVDGAIRSDTREMALRRAVSKPGAKAKDFFLGAGAYADPIDSLLRIAAILKIKGFAIGGPVQAGRILDFGQEGPDLSILVAQEDPVGALLDRGQMPAVRGPARLSQAVSAWQALHGAAANIQDLELRCGIVIAGGVVHNDARSVG